MNAHPGPLLFLDDDAVVVGRCRPGDREPVNNRKFGTVLIEDPSLSEPMQVTYSKLAVGFINNASRMYETRWLVSSKWLPRVLAPAIGLDRFESAGRYAIEDDADLHPQGDGLSWWKTLVVIEEASYRRFVWIDDQITTRLTRRLNEATAPWQCLLVPVAQGQPLSDHQLEQIALFVGVRRANR